MEEIEDGFFYKVQGKVLAEASKPQKILFCQGTVLASAHKKFCGLQWVEVGDVEVDTGANASAEEAEEGVDSASRKVVDIQDSFRLNVRLHSF